MFGYLSRLWDVVEGHIKRRPRTYAVVGFFVLFLPEWLPSVWSMFSSEPLVPTIRAGVSKVTHGRLSVPVWAFSISHWGVQAVGLVLLLRIFQQTKRAPVLDVAPQPPPPPSTVAVDLQWHEGKEPVLEVINKGNTTFLCAVTGQIVKAAPLHRRRDSFDASWRNHYKSDRWVEIEPGDRRKILVAYVKTNMYGGQQWAVVPQHGGDAEAWELHRFEFAEVLFSVQTRPFIADKIRDWQRLTWNQRREIFELAKPLEGDD